MSPQTPLNQARRQRSLALAAIALLPLAASAQVAPAPTESTPPKEQVLQLSPFTVESERDYGYRSTMSTSASGSGLAIKDTPLSISIINSEFLADKNLTDVREALRYVPGVVASTTKEEREIYSRGFAPIVKQDGAELSGAVLSSNFVDRIEVVKGPVSVLQGVASAGGVVNMISRRPKWNYQTTLELGVGDYGYRKGFLSASGPLLGDKLAYIAEASRIEAADGWADYTDKVDMDYHLGLEIKPVRRVSLLVDFQQTNRHEVPYQHLTFSNPDFVAAELEAERLYDANNLPRPASAVQIGEQVSTWLARKGYPANTPTETVNVNELVYANGYQANIQGPDALRDLDSYRFYAEANFEINESLYFRSLYADSETNIHFIVLSTFRPAGGWTIPVGAQEQRSITKAETFDNQLVGKFDLLGTKNRVLVGYQHTEQESGNKTITGPVKLFNTRTGPVRHILAEILSTNPGGVPPVVLSGGKVDSFYALEQLQAWDGRLTGLFGARYSKSKQGTLTSAKTTPQIGAVVGITKSISAFAGYGESFRPNFVVDGYGNIVDPTEESNFEYGLKFETPDGKFSGTVSVYDIEQKNVALRDFALEAATGVSPLYNVSGLAVSKGAEVEFIYAPMRNYQIVASYANNWEAKTVVAQDVRQQGVRLLGAPEDQFSFWNKYTFIDGKLKGLYLGAGVQFTGKMHIHPSWSSMIYNPEVWVFDATIGYQFKINKVTSDVILRVNNITDEFAYDATFRPSLPRNFQLLTRFKF
jgi:outer membrane receptor for ferric coprogen and ferric-rhodotorulic acid